MGITLYTVQKKYGKYIVMEHNSVEIKLQCNGNGHENHLMQIIWENML